MIGYVKHFNSNKTMLFKVSDNMGIQQNMGKNYWIKKLDLKFDSQPVYGDGDKYIKTKIKMYGDRTNFQGKKCLKKLLHINAYH